MRIVLFLIGLQAFYASAQERSLLLTGGRIHTAAGAFFENGALGIKGDTICFVGKADEADASGYDRVEELNGRHVYPGLIAMNTTLGLTEIFAVRATRDYREVGDMNPNARSIIAYNAESEITATVLANGILFAQIRPKGGIISGTSSVVKLKAWNWEDAAYEMDEGIHLNWPRTFKRKGEKGDPRAYEPDEDYVDELNDLHAFFAEAKAYANQNYTLERDLRLEAMRGIFSGEKRLYVEADFIKEIREVIAFKREMNIPKLTLVSGYESWKAADLLNENDISVLIRRVISLPRLAEDDIDDSFELAQKLAEAGVKFAFQMDGDMEPIQNRNIAFAAGVAIANGLDREEALRGLTIYPAEILDIADRTGSLEVGKEADLIVTEGDLFDIRTGSVRRIYLHGQLIDPENRQDALYKKYLRKYDLPE